MQTKSVCLETLPWVRPCRLHVFVSEDSSGHPDFYSPFSHQTSFTAALVYTLITFQQEAVLGLNSNQLEHSQILDKLEKIKIDPPPGVKDQVNLTAISLSAMQETCDLLVTVALPDALCT